MNFEFRGITILLLIRIGEAAKIVDSINPWSIARISSVLLGSHESLTDDNRWLKDEYFILENCVGFKYMDSIINILKDFYREIPHPLLNVTYDQVVGEKANIFVSFSYNSDFFELIDSIEQYFINNPNLNKDTTYFWVDMIVNNQFKAAEKDFDWWTGTFKSAIGTIGSVLLFLSKWEEGPLLRAWCIFELYCTAINVCKFEVIMSELNQKIFLHNILKDPTNEINKMLSIIKSINSSCFVESDKTKIHGVIEKMIGFDVIDSMIFKQLRTWLIQTTVLQYNNEIDEIKKLSIQHCLGDLYKNQGSYSTAGAIFAECFDKRKLLLGANNPDTLLTMSYLARVYRSQGKYELGEILIECLNNQILVLGVDHPDTLDSMNHLGLLYNNQNKLDKAELMHLDCLQRRKCILGIDNPETLTSMNNLAALYCNQNRIFEAFELYVDCLNKRKIILGNEHPDTLYSMNNLAMSYAAQGNNAKAELLYIDCLDKCKTILGFGHSYTLSSMSNLASLYAKQWKNDLAEPLQVECLRRKTEIQGINAPDTMTSMLELAILYVNQGKIDQAELLFVDCLKRRKNVYPLGHPDILSLISNLANLYKNQGKYNENELFLNGSNADVLYIECLDKYRVLLGENNPFTLCSINCLACLYENQDKNELAESLYIECLDKCKNVYGLDHPNTLNSMNNLGNFYFKQGKFDLVEPLFLECLDKRKIKFGLDHPYTIISTNNLKTFYSHIEK